jgi:V8-like Glu-specific endopeptidase
VKTTTIRPAAAGAAWWLVVTVVQANIFVLDRRERRDGTLPPYRSVGVLHHSTTRAGGTAFLIGRCHVLTAFHVAFMRDVDAKTGRVRLRDGGAAALSDQRAQSAGPPRRDRQAARAAGRRGQAPPSRPA